MPIRSVFQLIVRNMWSERYVSCCNAKQVFSQSLSYAFKIKSKTHKHKSQILKFPMI